MIRRTDKEANREEMQPVIPEQKKPGFSEKLTRNMALAGMLVLCVSAVKSARLPSGQTVLTAVQRIIQPELNDHLGAIDFVGNFFPETVSVFFESSAPAHLTAPCFGNTVHAWSENEPYLSYQTTANGLVYAAADGQVMALGHGMDEEMIVRLRHEDGLETMYYNMGQVYVREGDTVTAETCLGEALSNKEVTIEVRRAGRAVDPTAWMQPRTAP